MAVLVLAVMGGVRGPTVSVMEQGAPLGRRGVVGGHPRARARAAAAAAAAAAAVVADGRALPPQNDARPERGRRARG